MVNYSYFETHEMPEGPTRNKRKRVNELDPNGDKADKIYKDNYGL